MVRFFSLEPPLVAPSVAYRLGRTTVIAPFIYSFALWGVVSGLIVWRVLPNPLALAGIAVIAVSGVAIILLDQRRGRSQLPLTDLYEHRVPEVTG